MFSDKKKCYFGCSFTSDNNKLKQFTVCVVVCSTY
jgi:hypothetical protein